MPKTGKSIPGQENSVYQAEVESEVRETEA